MSEKFINIYCWKCGGRHHLADNGWNAIVCQYCGVEIQYPKRQPTLVTADLPNACHKCDGEGYVDEIIGVKCDKCDGSGQAETSQSG